MRHKLAAAAVLGFIAQASLAHAGYWESDWTNEALAADLVHPTRMNFSYAPGADNPHSGTLLLFVPGSGQPPSVYQTFMREAASKGYYVVGLDYENDNSEWGMCGCESQCYGDLWLQSVEDEDYPAGKVFYDATYAALNVPGESVNTIARHNSIGHRLPMFLQLVMANQSEGENWGQFLDGDVMKWSKVVVAGHSRGSDIATWMMLNKGTKATLGFSAINNWTFNSPATTCDTPALYRWVGAKCSDGAGFSECTPTMDLPAWEPYPRDAPLANLYLFDSVNDPYFNQDTQNEQYFNTVDFGWTSSTGYAGMTVIFNCPSGAFAPTSNWIIDGNQESTHESTVMDDNVDPEFGARDCVWDYMLSLP